MPSRQVRLLGRVARGSQADHPTVGAILKEVIAVKVVELIHHAIWHD